jgi:hypothetical protein
MPNYSMVPGESGGGGGGGGVVVDAEGFLRVTSTPGFVPFKNTMEDAGGGNLRLQHIIRDDTDAVDRVVADVTVPK